jgi:uncharacterized protein YjdB
MKKNNLIISPSNASGGIAWSSSNPVIASVNPSGVVTGVAAGTAVITATAGNNLTATCTVTITKWATYPNNLGDVSAMAIDAEENKWIGTYVGGVWRFDGANWTNYTTANSGLAFDDVWGVAIDAQGNKWFVSGNVLSELYAQ